MGTNKKPLGITAATIYAALSGLIYFPVGLVLLLASQVPDSSSLYTAGGMLMCVLGVFMLASVYGLWSLQEWGRVLAIWLSGTSVVLGGISIFPIWPNQQFTVANAALQLVGIGISALIIAYLTRQPIKGLFDRDTP
jgi:FtsH-binding integral membrane protein